MIVTFSFYDWEISFYYYIFISFFFFFPSAPDCYYISPRLLNSLTQRRSESESAALKPEPEKLENLVASSRCGYCGLPSRQISIFLLFFLYNKNTHILPSPVFDVAIEYAFEPTNSYFIYLCLFANIPIEMMFLCPFFFLSFFLFFCLISGPFLSPPTAYRLIQFPLDARVRLCRSFF